VFIDRNDGVMRLLPAESSKHIAILSGSYSQVAKRSTKTRIETKLFSASRKNLYMLTQKLLRKSFIKNAYAIAPQILFL